MKNIPFSGPSTPWVPPPDKIECSQIEHYDPSPEEVAELEEMERMQRECKHSHKSEDLDPEDGCVHCGFNAK